MAGHRQDTTPPQAGMARRILRYPLVWMVGGILLVFLVPAILVSILPGMNRATTPVVGAAIAVALYCWVMRAWAGRRLTEFPRAHAARDLSRGLLLGVALMVVVLAIVTAAGGYTMTWQGLSWSAIWPALLVPIWPAVVEELTFRGVVLQALERVGGSWVGLLGSAALFGLLHANNPGATVWSVVAISLEAGLLLGGAFLLVRNLWLPMGIHYAWDGIQYLVGVPQGEETVDRGLWEVTAQEWPGWLSGLPSALEASVVAVAIGVLVGVGLLVAAVRRGTLRRPGHHRQASA